MNRANQGVLGADGRCDQSRDAENERQRLTVNQGGGIYVRVQRMGLFSSQRGSWAEGNTADGADKRD